MFFCIIFSVALPFFRWVSSDFGDFPDSIHIDDFDFSPINCHDFLSRKCRERAYGIGSGHVGQVGKVFPGEVDRKRGSILLKPIAFLEKKQCFCESSPDMLLRERHGSLVGHSEVERELSDEEKGQR